MPLYEYQCEACQTRFEKIQKFSDPPIDVCPTCGKGPVKKLLSSPAIQFKGSGWYITDYAKKSGTDAGKSSTDASSSSSSPTTASSSSTESKAADTKKD
jgi:putative FmdB family regulatory protein